MAICLCLVYGSFRVTAAELNVYGRDHIAHKPENIYFLVLYSGSPEKQNHQDIYRHTEIYYEGLAHVITEVGKFYDCCLQAGEPGHVVAVF